ncbi:MAG: glutathione S-transferase family protein [Sulfuricella sp.]
MPKLHLVSHAICPYVQRAVIALLEKNAPFERTNIDFNDLPDWFKAISPLGKVPLLQVDQEVIFESAVICEYLDETIAPHLHPEDPLKRAQHRAWIEFGSAILVTIWEFNTASDAQTLEAKRKELQSRFETIEKTLKEGPYFAGENFSLVDAAFAPIFRYFDVYDSIADFGVFANTPKVRAWRQALALRPSVKNAVAADYPQKLIGFIKGRDSELSRHIAASI